MLPMSPGAGLSMPLTSLSSLEWPKSTLTRRALHTRLLCCILASAGGLSCLPAAAGASRGRPYTTVAWTEFTAASQGAATACQLQQVLLPRQCWMLEDRRQAVQAVTGNAQTSVSMVRCWLAAFHSSC